MRLKTFHADTMSAAMKLVRETLGENAIIVSAQEDEGNRGARVTAAVEEQNDSFDFFSEGTPDEVLNLLTDVLEEHGVPTPLVDRLVDAASDVSETHPEKALAGALEQLFTFNPLPESTGGPPIMFIGPPGVGKTVCCAKLAARIALSSEHMEDIPVSLIAADAVRVGAVQQLKAYADHLGARLIEAPDGPALAAALTQCGRGDIIIIDTPGTNPYSMHELAHLVALAENSKPETVLVMAAGKDAEEAAELAKAFRPVGAKRLLTTGLDVARRLGSVLAAAEAGELALSDISLAPQIGEGLRPLDSAYLARLLLPHEEEVEKAAPQSIAHKDVFQEGLS